MNERLSVRCGERRAEFICDEQGWRPDWFYLAQAPMLRFKDHDFLSFTIDRPRAQRVEHVGEGLRFSARTDYAGVAIDWSVTVTPETAFEGFTVHTTFTPAATVELMEAMSFLETPADYDHSEDALHVMGMNPVAQWRGRDHVTPALWWVPDIAHNHPRSVRNLCPTQSPYLCTKLNNAAGQRCYSLFAHWDACDHRIIAATPRQHAKPHSYQFVVGAMTWRTAIHKDPNFIFEAGRPYQQKLSVSYSTDMPAATIDEWSHRMLRYAIDTQLPGDGRLRAHDLARAKGVSLAAANRWFIDRVTGEEPYHELYHPTRGIPGYIAGTDPMPKQNWRTTQTYLWQAGHVAYQALVTGAPEFIERHQRVQLPVLKQTLAKEPREQNYPVLPKAVHSAVQYLRIAPDDELRTLLVPYVDRLGTCDLQGDHGAEAQHAWALAEAGSFYGNDAWVKRADELMAAVAGCLDADFWHFPCDYHAPVGSFCFSKNASYGQMHTQGPAAGVHTALHFYRMTGEARYLEVAKRLARYLASICYAATNTSDDEEFDFRGWANAANSGRDMYGVFPPWEASDGIRAFAALLEYWLDPSLYDLVWYFSRTYLAAFPAARRNKRGWTPAGRQVLIRGDTVATDRTLYRDLYPYIAYEDPYNQTMLSPYQSLDVLPNYLAFGGALAAADDDRLLVLSPRAVRFELSERRERVAHVWNPAPEEIATRVTWPGLAETQTVRVPARSAAVVRTAPVQI